MVIVTENPLEFGVTSLRIGTSLGVRLGVGVEVEVEVGVMVGVLVGVMVGVRLGVGEQQQAVEAANLFPTNKILLSCMIRGATIIFP